MTERETRLKKAIEAIDTYYDYILVDCPPSLGLLTVNAMTAVDEVLIPIQCEYYALEGLGQLLNNINLIKEHLNPDLLVSTILLTMYDGADQARRPGRQRGPEPFRAQGSHHLDPEVGEGLRGPGLRAVGDDLRPRFTRRHELHGRRPRDRRTRHEGAVMTGKARGGLGRGLAALIPTGPETTTVADVLINGGAPAA